MFWTGCSGKEEQGKSRVHHFKGIILDAFALSTRLMLTCFSVMLKKAFSLSGLAFLFRKLAVEGLQVPCVNMNAQGAFLSS